MTDSHFSDSRNRSSNQDRPSNHLRKPSTQTHNKSPNQPHSRSLSNQSQRQQLEFNNKFLKLFQGAQNKFLTIDKNFEYINDCLEQCTEKNIEDQIL